MDRVTRDEVPSRSQTSWQQVEPSQCLEQRLAAGSSGRSPAILVPVVVMTGFVIALEDDLALGRIVADALDVKKTTVRLVADLRQLGRLRS